MSRESLGGPDGRSWRHLALVIVVVGTLVLPVLGGAAAARPPPHAVCGVCSDALVDAAETEGLDVGIEESTLDVRLDSSGTGHWTARVHLTGAGVDRLTENATLRDRVVRRVYERSYVAVDDPHSLTTAMDGQALVVTHTVPEMAHESAGDVLVVDFFYWQDGDARWFTLDADRMTMRGPAGHVVTHTPAETNVADDAVTWEGPTQEFESLGARTHVAFAPDGGVASQGVTAVAIGLDVADVKLQDVAVVGVPTVVLGAVVALLRARGASLAARSWTTRLAVVVGPLVALGGLVAAWETLAGVSGPLSEQFDDLLFYPLYVLGVTGAGTPLVFGVPLAIGQALLVRSGGPETRPSTGHESDAGRVRWLVRVVAGLVVAQWLCLPLALGGGAGYDGLYGFLSLVLPVLYFVPLAVTHRLQHPLRVVFGAGIVLAAVPVVVGVAPHTRLGLVLDSSLLFYVPWALVVAAVGALAYAWPYRSFSSESAEGGIGRTDTCD